jgi:membrane-associated protein
MPEPVSVSVFCFHFCPMIEILHQALDFFLHLDKHLNNIVCEYGTLTYLILFLIVFVETGLVVMPLLPGDSLLFAVGALASTATVCPGQGQEGLNILVVIPLLIAAALLGDNVNYFIGKTFGTQISKREKILFFKREYLTRTEEFYTRHGGQTVIIARFVPIVRTLAPFVAGAGSMNYRKYITFCIIGAVLWVVGISMLGYLFGQIPVIKNNFEIVVLAIIGFSVLPIILQFFKKKPA